MKSIPVSKIDVLIAELEEINQSGDFNDTINNLEDMKEESEEMIPMSIVEARIKEIESYPSDFWKCYDDHYQMIIDELKKLLE